MDPISTGFSNEMSSMTTNAGVVCPLNTVQGGAQGGRVPSYSSHTQDHHHHLDIARYPTSRT